MRACDTSSRPPMHFNALAYCGIESARAYVSVRMRVCLAGRGWKMPVERVCERAFLRDEIRRNRGLCGDLFIEFAYLIYDWGNRAWWARWMRIERYLRSACIVFLSKCGWYGFFAKRSLPFRNKLRLSRYLAHWEEICSRMMIFHLGDKREEFAPL